jgi:hypothetical protein
MNRTYFFNGLLMFSIFIIILIENQFNLFGYIPFQFLILGSFYWYGRYVEKKIKKEVRE